MILCDENYPKIFDDIFDFLNLVGDVELVFVDNLEIKQINKETRNIDKITDVLSFEFINEINFNHFFGSIVINLELCNEKAKEFGNSIEDEITLMFIHGLLHTIGYDHEKDSGQMRNKEEEIINHFKLPKSLIIRTLD